MRKFLSLTVDVEAQPARAPEAHVDRLIYGRVEDGQFGLPQILSISRNADYTCTCFLDYPEIDLWGERIADVGRMIVQSNHDLQLHAHPEFFASETLQALGIQRPRGMDGCDDRQAESIVNWICERHREIAGRAPVAFRGGGYRYNASVLKALRAQGVSVVSNVNAAQQQSAARLPRRPFAWESGLTEFPVTTAEIRGRTTMANFNLKRLSSPDRVIAFLDAVETACTWAGTDIHLVLVLHSWSLLVMGADGHYGSAGKAEQQRLRALLNLLQKSGFEDLHSAACQKWLKQERSCPPHS